MLCRLVIVLARDGAVATAAVNDCPVPCPLHPFPACLPVCSYGVAFLHETQSEGEQVVARLLFESGAVQVLVATAPMCWGLAASAHLTVIMGTQVGGGCVGLPLLLLLLQSRLHAECCTAMRPVPSPKVAPPPSSITLPCTVPPACLQYYDVTGQGTNDYPVTDLLQMMGRASRPLHDEQGM